MNGAESLVRTLVAGGVKVCFANPGTSEMHIVAALDTAPEIRCVLGLFEGVATGAADGYARMTEKPACTLLHLGPGLANGLANLHNASRAKSPILNIVGQHAVQHLPYDTPLTSDIEGIARPYSKWLRTSRNAAAVGRDAAEGLIASRSEQGQIGTLIVPADAAWSNGGKVAEISTLPRGKQPSLAAVDYAAKMLRFGLRTAIMLYGKSLYGKGLQIAGNIAAATGAKLLSPYPFARMERGMGVPVVERTNYVLEQAVEQLKDFRQLILVGAQPPVAYFAYPEKTSVLTSPDCTIHTLATAEEDAVSALDVLAEALSISRSNSMPRTKMPRASTLSGEITLSGLASVVGALLPENAIVVDESMTSGRGMMAATKGAPAHDWLANTGGSIGIALPLAVGAAVACPERKVLCLSADGSSMYTLQALWTMARESLDITTVVFANRAYGVLKREFAGLGVGDPGPHAQSLFDIGHPNLDWVQLAKGMGVPAQRADSLEDFARALQAGFEGNGPSLIEVPL
ncbi:MAG: acetolactate synthase large subunit [Terriglobales bacterium]|jgi:acetolactate synthase I/II/III large subunit